MLVIKTKNRKNRQKYIVGEGLALIPPDKNINTCCNTVPVSSSMARKALTEKSKEFLQELKKNQS